MKIKLIILLENHETTKILIWIHIKKKLFFYFKRFWNQNKTKFLEVLK